MKKTDPKELWRDILLERFETFRASGELERLQREGLQALNRRKRLSSLEYWNLPLVGGPNAYQSWEKECQRVAVRFGLAPWTVEMACLLKGYDPQETLFPLGLHWPRIRIVTSHSDPLFLKHLFYHARQMGVPVYLRQAGQEIVPLFLDYEFTPSTLPDGHKPPFHDVFKIELELPPVFPSQAQKKIARDAFQLSRELLFRLGYQVPKRLRASSLLSNAPELRLNKSRLAPRELYEIVAETSDLGTIEEDEKRRKQVKSRRFDLRQRLIKPFEKEKEK